MQTGMTQGTSVFAALRQTLVKEGIRGAYRGVSAPVVAISPVYALSFWGYELGQEAVRFATNKTEKEPCSLPELCFAGGLSAFPATMITAPSERIKCLLQIQTLTASAASPPKYTGMIDCAIQLLKTGGIRSLYKGFTLTLLRDVPGSITWFGVYEVMKSQLVKVEGVDDTKQLSIFSVLMSGGISGMATWTVSIPFDVLKSRYQTAAEGTYKSLFDVYRHLIKTEGAGALFTGIRPALIRAFPANASCFYVAELVKKMMGDA